MKLGIVGLPNVGKSTLFNAITQAGALVANYPFATIDANIGVVNVPDKRLDALAEMFHPEKYTPATIEFVDIAGLVAGASKGEGLGNQFLGNIREVDAIVEVVRCFSDPQITHVAGTVDAARDIDTINLELIFADMDYLQRRIDKVSRVVKGDKSHQLELDTCERIMAHLEEGKSARTLQLEEEELEAIADLELLSAKPILYVANVSEEEMTRDEPVGEAKVVYERAAEENSLAIMVSAKIEEEIASLDPEERQLFLDDLGLSESGLDKVIHSGYKLLGLISYLTAGPKEVRAWTIAEGTKAPQAAGKIHSDFERGFIRAEIVSFTDLMASGSMAAAKEKGLYRSEGKEYVVKDGDVVLYRFNV